MRQGVHQMCSKHCFPIKNFGGVFDTRACQPAYQIRRPSFVDSFFLERQSQNHALSSSSSECVLWKVPWIIFRQDPLGFFFTSRIFVILSLSDARLKSSGKYRRRVVFYFENRIMQVWGPNRSSVRIAQIDARVVRYS